MKTEKQYIKFAEKHDRAQELKEDDFKHRNGFLGQDEEY